MLKNLKGISGVPEEEDTPISREQILANWRAFKFQDPSHVEIYEGLLRRGFGVIREDADKADQLFADTKFEVGYVEGRLGQLEMIYIDEAGTPDSSRFWPKSRYNATPRVVVEESKEGFRQFLLKTLDRDVLLDGKRMAERRQLAANYKVPVEVMMEVSRTYAGMVERLTGNPLPRVENARGEIMDAVSRLGLAN